MKDLQLFYDNRWVKAGDGRTFTSRNPCTGDEIARLASASRADTAKAIEAAARAFSAGVWSGLDREERAVYLHRVADGMEKRFEELARWEAMDTGKPIRETRSIDIPLSIRALRFHADLAKSVRGHVVQVPGRHLFDYVTYEPFGVVGSIAPWNFPLHLLTRSIGAALAAGNTVVCKPSTLTPVTAQLLAEIFLEAEVPAGVYNTVTGAGSVVGEELLAHDMVDMVALTGSEPVGRRLMEASARATRIKKLSLELGGKSAMLVDVNCDLSAAVNAAIQGFCTNQGEVCVSTSRLLLPRALSEKFIDSMQRKLKQLVIGDCLDPGTHIGALIDEGQLVSVQGFVDRAVAQGARLRAGGKRLTGGIYDKGSYYPPTVLDQVTPEMEIFHEEVFGPVLAVSVYDTMEEAVELANATRFGLGAAIFSEDIRTIYHVAERLDAGTVWMNCVSKSNIETPFGGNRNSGLGREDGLEGLLEYMRTKNHILAVAPQYENFFGLRDE